MNILFLAEPYLNLHLPIIEEMERQGHNVTFVKDEHLPFDWHEPWRGFRDKAVRITKAYLLRSYQKYWKQRFKKQNEFNGKYDILFVINGCCFHPVLLQHLRIRSPHLKTVLYLWDNSAFYDYFHNANLFDKIATYDFNDAIHYKANFLPFYWLESVKSDLPLKYKISTVGTNHDGRLSICRRIHKFMIENNIPENEIFLRIVDNTISEDEIITNSSIPVNETLCIMQQSNCVLDTDRESQSGTTPRLIWAIAMGKKIITTNKNISKFEFFSPEQIMIIDRENPEIPISFITDPLPKDFKVPNIDKLRIDKWVKSLLRSSAIIFP